MLGIAPSEHRGGRERGAVLKSALAEHGEAWKGAAVLGIASPEHRGGKERGAVLKSAPAEHGEARKGAAVLGIAPSEHIGGSERPPRCSKLPSLSTGETEKGLRISGGP